MSNDPVISRRTVMRGAAVVGGAIAFGGLEVFRATPVSADVGNPGIYSCDEWGARAPLPLTEIDTNPNKILIHHTASSNDTGTSLEDAFSIAQAIQSWHMDDNGWSDTGQHFTVSRGGYALEGRHTSLGHLDSGSGMVVGAHAPGQNDEAIGIENEGTFTDVEPPEAIWNKLVELCAYICQQYGIAPTEIYGHRDFTATECPGETFYNMLPQLRDDVAAFLDGGGDPPDPPDWQVTVDNADDGFSASENWGVSTWSSERVGDDYRYAEPVLESDAAYFNVDIPQAGDYQIETAYPADPGYNSSTPFIVFAADGNHTVSVDQRTNVGTWVDLGTYSLAAGSAAVVAVSRWTSSAGYVIADAVRITRV